MRLTVDKDCMVLSLRAVRPPLRCPRCRRGRRAGLFHRNGRGDRHLLRSGRRLRGFRGGCRERRRAGDPGQRYSLTIGSGIPEALARAAQRGVNVRLIADKTTPCERKAGMDLIVSAGASVWIDRGVRIAHSKTMVIDGKVT